ncbi:hypothetical protein AY599_26965 [Leptolyngbya valderiana BDU 20041]|nr:hypothetical protein AY599_26965 [Leptolyngbya valderiana BDU 20041]
MQPRQLDSSRNGICYNSPETRGESNMAKSIPLPNLDRRAERDSARPWTEIAETASIIASGGGVALAIVFQQLVFAIVPPVFALSFNIVNRSRRLQHIREQSSNATVQTNQLRSDLQAVQSSLQTLPIADRIVDIERCVTRLSEALMEVQQRQTEAIAATEEDREKIKEAFAIVRQGVYNLSHHTNSSLDRLRSDFETLRVDRDRTTVRTSADAVETAIAPLRQQVEGLTQRVDNLDRQSTLITPQVQQLTKAVKQLRTHTARHWLERIDRRLESALPYTYSLVSDDASEFLYQALTTAKEHVAIVTPWLQHQGTHSDRFLAQLEEALQQNLFVSIGWGRRADIGKARGTSRPIALKDGGWRYQIDRDPQGHYRLLPQLLGLKKRYKRLDLKLLGTADRLVTCDREWALLGGRHLLCSHDEEEVGLYTSDPHVVSDLVDRFDLVPQLQRRASRQMPAPPERRSLSALSSPSEKPAVGKPSSISYFR